MVEFQKKPIKAKNLKIIDYVGILYGTINGDQLWEMDKLAFEVLKLCDGGRTVDQITEKIAKKANLNPEDVNSIVKSILNELERLKFIEYV